MVARSDELKGKQVGGQSDATTGQSFQFSTKLLLAIAFFSGLICIVHPSANVTEALVSRRLQSDNGTPKLSVGVYYYPWHGKNFHNGGGYLREKLSHTPQLGEYDDTDPEVIRQHLAWSQYANIGLWVTSWWGEGKIEDTTTKNVILDVIEGTSHKIALHYETTSRMKGENGTKSTHRVTDDINYICDTYFGHPNYFRIDDRPVLVLYVTRTLDDVPGLLQEALLLARTAAAKKGYNIYLVGDQAFGKPPIENNELTYEADSFDYLDAITNYDVYGSMGRGYVNNDAIKAFYDKQWIWRRLAKKEGCAFIPSVTPGYNDQGVRPEAKHAPLSRRLSPTSPEGSFFEASLKRAIGLVDPSAQNLLLVNSFNEWHEDTQIEPCVGKTTNEPQELTGGLEYVAYGDIYLDILKRMTPGAAVQETSTKASPKEKEVNVAAKDEALRSQPPRSGSWREHRSRNYHDRLDEADEEDLEIGDR
jgi:hypothetical protein